MDVRHKQRCSLSKPGAIVCTIKFFMLNFDLEKAESLKKILRKAPDFWKRSSDTEKKAKTIACYIKWMKKKNGMAENTAYIKGKRRSFGNVRQNNKKKRLAHLKKNYDKKEKQFIRSL